MSINAGFESIDGDWEVGDPGIGPEGTARTAPRAFRKTLDIRLGFRHAGLQR